MSDADTSTTTGGSTASGDRLGRGVVLYTPAQAAGLLSVPESWLRRKAGQRRIPSTRLGKHLRFSRADLVRIAEDGSQATRQQRLPGNGRR